MPHTSKRTFEPTRGGGRQIASRISWRYLGLCPDQNTHSLWAHPGDDSSILSSSLEVICTQNISRIKLNTNHRQYFLLAEKGASSKGPLSAVSPKKIREVYNCIILNSTRYVCSCIPNSEFRSLCYEKHANRDCSCVSPSSAVGSKSKTGRNRSNIGFISVLTTRKANLLSGPATRSRR